jgi:hypothetical protein
MATFCIGNKKVMGGGVGSVATASTASMANNAQQLNGVSQNRILEKWEIVKTELETIVGFKAAHPN